MDFDSFKSQWLGHRIADPTLGAVGLPESQWYQCVSLIKQYLRQDFNIEAGFWGDAIDYWTRTNAALLTKFTKVGSSEAQKGDIVVITPNHIGIATGNINATEVEILEENGSTGNGSGLGGDAIRVRYVNRSRVAGLLRPIQAAAAPAAGPVHPYTIEAIPSKEIKINRDTHKWGLNYDNFTAINNNPEGTAAAGQVVTVSAILHHNIGYSYYLPDPNQASGYNVVDCDDYTPPPIVNPTPTPAPGALHPSSTETYEVVRDIPGYLSSNQAINHINEKVTIPVGTYFIFNRRDPALNITKTPGTPGAWVNPADNVVEPPAPPAPEPVAPVATPEPEPEHIPSFAYTYKSFERPELFVAMRTLKVSDLDGRHKSAAMPQFSVTYISGTFMVDGIDYARPKSAADKDWWHGIPWVDPITNTSNLELESEVFNAKTTVGERLATRTLHPADYLLLALAHLKNFYLGFTKLISKMKA